MAIEDLSLDLLRPGTLSFDIAAAAVETPRSLSGVFGAVDFSGGGFVTVKYGRIQIGNSSPSALRYWSRLGAQLAGGVRPIIVPLLTDFISPVNGLPPDVLATFSDASTLSDSARIAQSNVPAYLGEAANIAAGTLKISMDQAFSLEGGEWFSIFHTTRHHRAYRISDVDSVSDPVNGMRIWTVGIRPTLREAVAAGERVEFVRPRCLMRLAPGANAAFAVQGFWMAEPELALIEYPVVAVE
jgi:hypothetical protein